MSARRATAKNRAGASSSYRPDAVASIAMITRDDVELQLERARALGYLGDGPVADQFDHAASLMAVAGEIGGGTVLDLGSGGGLPGLVAALLAPTAQLTLLDRQARRTAFLRSAVAALGLADRCDVVTASAESAAHESAWRGRFDVVFARSFGPPPVVLECAGGFLSPQGVLIVAEPPSGDRWSDVDLSPYGMSLDSVGGGVRAACLRRTGEWPAQLPRAERLTRRKPLW